jgi:elongation factor 1-alpha
MSLPKINLVIIGHKDHGKSTLIGRLLYDSKVIPEQKLQEIRDELEKSGEKEFRFAFLLDSFREEREGGLTMDIMQTPFKTERHLYTIIDCPGHKEFIKNMITGASQADAAILVVSAREGIEDQTREHTFLTKMLGIDQLVIAMNKMDEISYDQRRFKEFSRELRHVMMPLGYEDAPIIPVSALSGENIVEKSERMRWFKGLTLVEALDEKVSPSTLPTDKPMRGWVQDIYNFETGKILACKIVSGILETGKEIVFQPTGQKGLVKKIEMFGEDVEKAEPGDSVGLVVDEIGKIGRGEAMSYSEDPVQPVREFVAEVIVLADLEIRNGDVLRIRLGTAEKKCEVQTILEKVDAVSFALQEKFPVLLRGGDVGRVRFVALEPVCLERYSEIPELGRFVVEGKRGTVGAGLVLEFG